MTSDCMRAGQIGVMGLLFVTGPAWAADARPEIDFVTRAADGDLMALAESRLAITRAVDPAVKTFAQHLLQAHEAAGPGLRDAAAGSGATPPTVLDRSHEARLATLQGEVGTAFDKTYMADQAEVHSNALTLYADYMLLGDNPRLKAYATSMIPVTEAEFKEAQTLLAR